MADQQLTIKEIIDNWPAISSALREEYNQMQFNVVLRKMLKKRGISAYRLGKIMGIHDNYTMTRIMTNSNGNKGPYNMKPEMLSKIIIALQASDEEAMELTNATNPYFVFMEYARKHGLSVSEYDAITKAVLNNKNITAYMAADYHVCD